MRASAGYPEASDGFIGRWFDVSEIGGLVRLLLAIFVLFSCGASLAIATLRPDLAERTASIEAEFAKLWPESRIARVANDGEALLALYGVTRVCAQLARREIACEVDDQSLAGGQGIRRRWPRPARPARRRRDRACRKGRCVGVPSAGRSRTGSRDMTQGKLTAGGRWARFDNRMSAVQAVSSFAVLGILPIPLDLLSEGRLGGGALVLAFVLACATWWGLAILADVFVRDPEIRRRRRLVEAAIAACWPDSRLEAIALCPVAVATLGELAGVCKAQGATYGSFVDLLECDGAAAIDAAALDIANVRVVRRRREIDDVSAMRRKADAVEGALAAARSTLPHGPVPAAA